MLYDQICDEDLVPVKDSIRNRGQKLLDNSMKKINPIIDPLPLEPSDSNRGNQNTDNFPTNNTGIHRGISMNASMSVTNELRYPSNTKSRNTGARELSNIIHEHEEEYKGTIDFKHRRSGMRNLEEFKHPRYLSMREESKSLVNDSIEPMIRPLEDEEDEEEKQHVQDSEIQRNMLERIERNRRGPSRIIEESSSREHNESDILRSLEPFEERKRSITARSIHRVSHNHESLSQTNREVPITNNIQTNNNYFPRPFNSNELWNQK